MDATSGMPGTGHVLHTRERVGLAHITMERGSMPVIGKAIVAELIMITTGTGSMIGTRAGIEITTTIIKLSTGENGPHSCTF